MSLKSKPVSLSSPKPTTAQLCKLAAALSKDGTEPAERLVNQALAVWEAAHELLTKPPLPPPVAAEPALPEPKRYPVKRDAFLRLMLPKLGGRSGEYSSIFRKYLRFRLEHPLPPDSIWAWDQVPDNPIPFDSCNPRIVPATEKSYSAEAAANPPEPTKDDENQYFALWGTHPIPDPHSFHYHARAFRDWYQTTHAAKVSAERRAAGAKGLASEKRKRKKSETPTSKA